MLSTPPPQASIIVLYLEGSPWIARCVDAVRRNVPPSVAHELIVLGNGVAADATPPVTGDERTLLLRSEINLGFGGGCNWAARHARGAFLVFLNDDAVVHAGWLEALLGAASEPSVTVAGSLVLTPEGRVEEAGRVLWRDGVSSGLEQGARPERLRIPAVREVDYVSFCSALVRHEAWSASGGFDLRYFPAYYEDNDLCLSLRRCGGSVVCAAHSRVTHARSASTGALWRRFLGLRQHRVFIAKWAPALQTFPPRPRDAPTPPEVEAAAQHAGERRRALYDASLMARQDEGEATTGATPGATDRLTLLELQLAALQADLQLKDEYIAHLGATAPDMERALARLLRDERRRVRRHELLRRMPFAASAAAWLRRRSRRRDAG